MNNIALVVGNLCTLLAMGANALSATRKTSKGVLIVQNIAQFSYCVGSIVLKGYSASVQNVVSILRNFAAIRKVNNKFVEWLLVILGVVLGIAFNNRGLVGLLPVIGNLEYTLAIFRFKDNERALKISFLICVAVYVIFNAAIQNYVGVAADLTVIITTAIVLCKPAKAEE